MRECLDDGYVEALRSVHPDVPESADLVMFWWNQAADRARHSDTRFGLITTKAITQSFNSRILAAHLLTETESLSVRFAIPNHPWVDSSTAAQVRIAMTCCARGRDIGKLCIVHREVDSGEDAPEVTLVCAVGTITPQLTIGIDTVGIVTLEANQDLAAEGVKPHGLGFVVTALEAEQLQSEQDPNTKRVVKPYANGRDIASKSREVLIIDLHGLTEAQVQQQYPRIYQWLLTKVKPERDQNREQYRRDNWWLFGRKNTELRSALSSLHRYIATVKTSKYRYFVFVQGDVLPDSKLIVVALVDAFHLGVLSSALHVAWSLKTGARLGVGDDPTYVKSKTFDCFPFPEPTEFTRQRIRNLAEQLDAHRKRQQSLHPDLTITGMYNVLEKLRGGEPLTDKEKVIHQQGLVSVLKQIHDDLDAAVFDAYGWPHDLTDEQILERLVALNAERAEEERHGIVRWLRPEFQNPAGARTAQQTTMAGVEIEETEAEVKPKAAAAWPKDLPSQIAAVRDLIAAGGDRTWTLDRAARAFKGAKRPQLQSVLDSLAALGLLVTFGEGNDRQWSSAPQDAPSRFRLANWYAMDNY